MYHVHTYILPLAYLDQLANLHSDTLRDLARHSSPGMERSNGNPSIAYTVSVSMLQLDRKNFTRFLFWDDISFGQNLNRVGSVPLATCEISISSV